MPTNAVYACVRTYCVITSLQLQYPMPQLSRFAHACFMPQMEVDATEDSESKAMRLQHAALLEQNEVHRP